MPTYKKHFRRNNKTIKKQNGKNNKGIRVLVYYKMLEKSKINKMIDNIKRKLDLEAKRKLDKKVFGGITGIITPLNIYNGTPEGVPLEIQWQQLPINELNGTPLKGARPISNLHRSKSTILNDSLSLGSWKKGGSNEDKNEQKINFLWYPRKNIDYEKGASGKKRPKDADKEYGDFMIIIEPEKHANTGEFLKKNYNSVDDLLANTLLGCNDIFCTDGVVKPKPYNWREYTITNNQPKIDNENKNKSL